MVDTGQHRQAGHGTSGAERPGRAIAQHVGGERALEALGDRQSVGDGSQLDRGPPHNTKHLALGLRPASRLVEQDAAQTSYYVGIEAAVSDKQALAPFVSQSVAGRNSFLQPLTSSPPRAAR